MRILVTGSRTWTDEDTIRKALFEAGEESSWDEQPIIIVHGGAQGADRIADHVARMFMWDIERYPANWSKNGKAAGFIRNQQMVDLGADVCLAFIKDDSKGATMCADLAEKAGIPVRRYTA